MWTLISTFTLIGVTVPRTASAFERQWHLGAGIGFAAPTRTYQTGGAVALHAAYGVSDMFDARIELRGSLHSKEGHADNTLLQSALGVAYKLDIIEWVPYLGVRAGYYLFGESLPRELSGGETYSRSGGMIGTMLGVDYALSRSAAVGLEFGYDTLLPQGAVFGAILRAEYRWGW